MSFSTEYCVAVAAICFPNTSDILKPKVSCHEAITHFHPLIPLLLPVCKLDTVSNMKAVQSYSICPLGLLSFP